MGFQLLATGNEGQLMTEGSQPLLRAINAGLKTSPA